MKNVIRQQPAISLVWLGSVTCARDAQAEMTEIVRADDRPGNPGKPQQVNGGKAREGRINENLAENIRQPEKMCDDSKHTSDARRVFPDCMLECVDIWHTVSLCEDGSSLCWLLPWNPLHIRADAVPHVHQWLSKRRRDITDVRHC